ncbi:unnamed protein product [Ilex paraguariensis]|uniref:C3H1-type domain-containing protein n=1 Tax=Ilex paraguariensis TaxID=185542 RepID=A0ABC8QQZ9_9AQUA
MSNGMNHDFGNLVDQAFEKAGRHDPCRYYYAAITCPSYRAEECERGETCHFSHGAFEHWLHLEKYRTRRCNAGPFCLRKVCFFAHSEHELLQEQPYGGDLTRYHNWLFGGIRVPVYAQAQGPGTHPEVIA